MHAGHLLIALIAGNHVLVLYSETLTSPTRESETGKSRAESNLRSHRSHLGQLAQLVDFRAWDLPSGLRPQALQAVTDQCKMF